MKLKTLVMVAGATAILGCLGITESLSHRQAVALFKHHEIRLQNGGDNEALLAALRQEQQAFLWESAALHLLAAVGAVATLAVAVHQLWGRHISTPIDLLRDRMNSMSLGTWAQPAAVGGQDEIGSLAEDFHLLGQRLIFAAHQYAASSRLAAMALIGRRVTRRTNEARRKLAELREMLSEARYQSQITPQSAMRQLDDIAEDLAGLEANLESGFNDELVRQGLPPGSVNRDLNPRQHELIAR